MMVFTRLSLQGAIIVPIALGSLPVLPLLPVAED